MLEPAPKFLTAGWYSLAMLNFPVDPAVLQPYLPSGTEIDFFHDRTFLSIVGFEFRDTRVLGLSLPFHRQFEEVNLRFYVRRLTEDGWRRGVVFIKEIAPRHLVSWIARWIYNENYVTLPMRHDTQIPAMNAGRVRYEWYFKQRWQHLALEIAGPPEFPDSDTEAYFIKEHYWGYTRQRDDSTVEYQVEHPPWRIWPALACDFDCDVTSLYSPDLAQYLQGKPCSAFVADGSPIIVRRGQMLRDVAVLT